MRYYDQIKFQPEEVLIYLRKSRTDEPNLSVEEVLVRHEEILRQWVDNNIGAPIPEANIYREVLSGEHLDDRPEIQKLLRRIETPKIKAVLVVEVQRLSRGDLEDAGRLIKLFRYTETYVITPGKTYDITDEYDRDFFKRELERGNDYLEYSKRIMHRGRYQSSSEGWYIGSVAPYGWKRISVMDGKRKRPTLTFNEETDTLRLMYDLAYHEHMLPDTIANRLNDLGIKPRNGKHWSSASIRGILANPVNNGKIVWNRRKSIITIEEQEPVTHRPVQHDGDYDIFEGKHEKLIEDEVFDAVKKLLKTNTHAGYSNNLRNPLARIVYCQCGHTMTLRTYKRDGKERSSPRLLCTDQAYCHTSSCLYSEMIEQVSRILENCIADFQIQLNNEPSEESMKTHQNILLDLQNKLKLAEKKELKQWESYTAGEMPKEIFEQLNEKVKKEKQELKQALENAHEIIPEQIDYQEKILKYTDALNALHNPDITPLEQNTLIRSVIDRIDYSRPDSVLLTADNCKKYGIEPEKLKTGANWYSPPMELSVKFKI